jgi:hypothetical protein
LRDDFSTEVQVLVQHLAGALGVPVSEVDVDIPSPKVQWPLLPQLELCVGSSASVNGMPFAKFDDGYTAPIRFEPPRKGQPAARGIASVYGQARK